MKSTEISKTGSLSAGRWPGSVWPHMVMWLALCSLKWMPPQLKLTAGTGITTRKATVWLLVDLSILCLLCSYINLWVVAASGTSLILPILTPQRGSHPTDATSSFTGSLQPVDPSLMDWAWQSPPSLGTPLVSQ